MTDIFISYEMESRRFVDRLQQSLKQNGKSVWVDWHGLRPSDRWLDEIFKAIEAAHTVVLIISPLFLDSKTCAKEVELAAKLNKRIIPILREDVDRSRLSPLITERHWIFCREKEDFDGAVAAVVRAIETDRDWVRAHTRLLTRALEWERSNRDSSFTLRGSDLENAELALTIEGNQQPALVPLQIEYILRSRQDANRRYRIGLGLSALGLTLVVIFGLLLWQQRHEQALTLASSFREKGILALTSNNPLAAELLFARSLAINNASGTRERLLEARARSPKLLWRNSHTAGLSILAIRQDARYFAAQTPASIEIWDLDRGTKLRDLPNSGYQLASFSSTGPALALYRNKQIEIWNFEADTQRPVRLYEVPSPIASVNIGADGKLLIAGAVTGEIYVWHLLDEGQGQPLELRGHKDRVTSVVATKDGRLVVSGSWDDSVGVWDLASGKRIATLTGHDDSLLAVALNSSEDLIASAGWDTTIVIWDLKTGRQLREFDGHQGAILNLAFSQHRNVLVSTSEDKTTRLWDVDKGRQLLTFAGSSRAVGFVGYRDTESEQRLAMADLGGDVRLWDLDAIGHRDELTTLKGHTAAVTMFNFVHQRPLLVSSSVDGSVRLWDLETGKTINVRKQSDRTYSVRMSPDGRHIAATPRGDAIQVWNLDSGKSLTLGAEFKSEGFRYVAYSPDGALLAAGSDSGVLRIWNVNEERLVSSFVAHSDKIQGLAFSPDGKVLASSADDSRVRLWSTENWKMAGDLAGHESGVYQISFSPDSKTLVSASDDKTARLWDVATGKEISPPLKHDSPVWTADFSPDGKLLATGGDDAIVRIWHFSRRGDNIELAPFSELRISSGPVWWLAFNQMPAGLQLAVGGQDKTIRLVNMSFVEGMLQNVSKLEHEAELRGGYTTEVKDGDIELVPLSLNSRGADAGGSEFWNLKPLR